MAVFKIVPVGENHSLKAKLNYILNPESTSSELVFTNFLSATEPYDEMILVKRCYQSQKNETLLYRQFMEFILSLNDFESERLDDFCSCVQEVMDLISTLDGGAYQIIGAIHTNTDNLHAHMVLNNINMQNGKRFALPRDELRNLKLKINDILNKHDFEKIEMHSLDCVDSA